MKIGDPRTNNEIKKSLRQTAKEINLDLSRPANRFTLWTRQGRWGYLCWGGAAYPSRIHELMGHYMFLDALILEAKGIESEDVLRRFICEVG